MILVEVRMSAHDRAAAWHHDHPATTLVAFLQMMDRPSFDPWRHGPERPEPDL